MKPPPLPEETLRRVLKVARANGWCVTIVAGLSALVSLAFGDLVGAGIGVLVSVGGVLELRGHRQLQQGDPDGMTRLVRSQLWMLGVIWAYAITRLASFDVTTVIGAVTPDMRSALDQAGVDLNAILPLVRLTFYLLYGSLIVVTLIYQGGLALYYRRRTAVVKAVLAARRHPVPPPRPPPLPVRADDDWSI